MNTINQRQDYSKLPRAFLWGTVLLSISPFVLNFLGLDFGNDRYSHFSELSGQVIQDGHFKMLSGAFTHTILEWSAFMLAILTCGLAFTNYAIKKDPVTPVLGVALLCAGVMDAFHTLAADRLIHAVAPNKDLIPFTWALCRLFNSLICLIGITMAFFGDIKKSKRSSAIIVFASFSFILIAYLTIYYCANSGSLPQTQFPGAFITRPWDVYPFIVFLVTGVAYYLYFRRRPSPFAHAMLLSTIPDVATQMHMALGSSTLFDNHFNIAHFLKIISYAIPYLGLTWSYITTNREKEALNEEMIEARDNARAAERAKSEFLANMSHEIRTPMNGVLGMIQLMGDTKLDKEQKEMLDITRSCGNSLMSILNDILDLSKIESGKFSLEDVNFNLKECVEEALFLSTYSASRKGLELLSDYKDLEESWLIGDVTRIRQIIVNFISNAVKFTETGHVKVICSSKMFSPGVLDIDIRVQDTGIGISLEDQQKLFQAFSQADTSTTRKFGGTGLGLSICYKLATAMDGSVSLVSEVGKGATFSFKIRLKKGVEERKDDLRFDSNNDAQEDKNFKILLVEDNMVNQKLAKMMLNRLGFQCDIAGNGIEALSALTNMNQKETNYYSLILMDMQMPEMDGIEATQKICERYGDVAPPIIAMTANAFEEDKKKCFEAGMIDFLAKPVKIKELKEVLSKFKALS